MVIDGIADLIRSANDDTESIAIVDELYRLAGIYNTCIICVLHFVPNGIKLRGISALSCSERRQGYSPLRRTTIQNIRLSRL